MADIPDYAQKTITDLQEKVAESERNTNRLKELVNTMCASYGADPLYDIVQTSAQGGSAARVPIAFRPDEFFGKPLATCVREFLTARKARGLGPAEPREVFEALKAGGYAFDTRDDDVAFRSMQISISKNTAAFVRLPSGQIGLDEWYERTRRPKGAKASAPSTTANPNAPWPLPESGATTGSEEPADEGEPL